MYFFAHSCCRAHFVFVIKHIRFQIIFQIHRGRCLQNAGIFNRQYICPVWWTHFLAKGRHSNGNKMCYSTCWPVPSLLWGWLYSWSDPKKRLSFSLFVCLLGFNSQAAIFQLYSGNEHEMDDNMNMKWLWNEKWDGTQGKWDREILIAM